MIVRLMERIKIEIDGRTTEFDVKSKWEELDFEDLKVAGRIVFDQVERDKGRMDLFIQLAQCDKKTLRHVGEEMLRDDDGVVFFMKLVDTVDFVYTTLPVFNLSECLEYRGYTGPADNLANIRVKQMRDAEAYFCDYIEHQEVRSLNALLSFLYWQDDFRHDRAPKMVKVVEGWPLEDRLAMLLNYMALRHHWLGVKPVPEEKAVTSEMVDEEVYDNPREYMKKQVLQTTAEMLTTIPFDLADGERYGSIQDIEQMLLPDLLLAIEQRNSEIARMKKK